MMEQFIEIKNAELTIHRKADVKIPKVFRDKEGRLKTFEFEGKKYYASSIMSGIDRFQQEKTEVEIWQVNE